MMLFALVFTAVTFIVAGDTFGKMLTGSGVNPFFVAWSRFALAAVVLLPFSGLRLGEVKHFANPAVLGRACLVAAGISFILTALRTEPIANVYGAFFIGPLVSFGLSCAFLGERPTQRHILLIALGFAGVMLVVKPGFGASAGMFFALCAGVCYGGYLALTRLAAPQFRPRFLLISQLMIGTVALAPFAASAPFPQISAQSGFWVLGSALFSAGGNYLLVIASRQAQATLIAPLIYTQLISATVVGIAVFAEWPDAVSLSGLSVILMSGLGSLRRSSPRP